MSAGVPIISTDTGAISELFDETECVLVSQNVKEELVISQFVEKIIDAINTWNVQMSFRLIEKFHDLNDYSKFRSSLSRIFNFEN
jgi:hypothetical protein